MNHKHGKMTIRILYKFWQLGCSILLVSDSCSTRSTSMSDGENDKEREAASQLSAREESEVIDILHQILEDADPCQLSAYTILERLRDEYESE